MNQRLIVIGKNGTDTDFVVKCLKDRDCIDKIVYWNNEDFSECLSLINETESVFVVCIRDNNEFGGPLINILTNVLHIDYNRFVDFYKIYYGSIPYMRVSRIMENRAKNNKVDGMILGISHAEVGIVPECFKDKHFINLAVSSQDIYYNYETLNYCYNNYYEQIKNMEYLIIDMFDYTYFNYDVSLGTEIINYIGFGGITLPHNYKFNKNYNYKYDDIVSTINMRRIEGITEEMLDLWDAFFVDPHKLNNYKDYISVNYEERMRIMTQKDIEDFEIKKPIVVNRYENTIKENVIWFEKILSLAKLINPQIKIYCILIPRFIDIQLKSEYLLSDWKREFYSIIKEMQKKYYFEFYDFNDDEMAKNPFYYYDPAHFNCIGAVEFTNKLKKYLKIN